jgi:hypothetical protein
MSQRLEVNNEIAERGQAYSECVNSKKITENDDQAVSAAGVITAVKKPINRCSTMEFWFYATTTAKNLAGVTP